ncbi:pentatricopeptide repeat-containing protein At2g13600-like [Typha angustifolia]|uniref:pentatricopeptide repeat-containing protein At2g13600-like n=1 Tax=Typha angustifolia TaxID=59011 RepID=UPI003C2AF357
MKASSRHLSTSVNSSAIPFQNPSPISAGTSQTIQSLAAVGRVADAIRLIVLCRSRGKLVNPNAFISILRPCATPKTLILGRQLHGHMVVSGFVDDTFVCNHLIHMYGKCGFLDDAHSVFNGMMKKNLHSWNTLLACYCKFGFLSEAERLFDEMPKRDAVSWNTMIAGYDQHGPCEEALQYFVWMRRSDCKVDHFGVSSVVSACSNLRSLRNGIELHGFLAKLGLHSHVQVGSALIGLYGKCIQLEAARKVFDDMGIKEIFTWNSMLHAYIKCSKIEQALIFFREMPEKNVVSWTTIVAGCSQHYRNEDAILYFHKMQEVGLRPDKASLVSALRACTELLDFEEGFKIHSLILKCGGGHDVIVGSVLVMLYSKCGYFTDAINVIDGMLLVDDFSWSVLIAEYAKHGMIDNARKIFESLEVKSIPIWNALIGGYSELGMDGEALEAFRKMQMDGMKGDEFTFGSLLMGADLLGLRYGEQLHLQTLKLGIDSSVFVGSALIDMYSYNLESEAAKRVLYLLGEPNTVCWNSMISGFGLNKLDTDIINIFCVMMILGVIADAVTFSLALDSCSNLLALNEGLQIHALACKFGLDSNVVVGSALINFYGKCDRLSCALHAFNELQEHSVVSWTALIGCYMRGGMWDMAKELFDMMPERNIVSWNTILSGCSKLGLPLEALQHYHQMSKLGLLPDHITFVSMLSVCSNFLLEENGKQFHAQIVKAGYHVNKHVSNAMTEMYQKFAELSRNEFSSGLFHTELGNEIAEPASPSRKY